MNFGSNLFIKVPVRLNFYDRHVISSITHKISGYIFKRSGICHTNLQNAFHFSLSYSQFSSSKESSLNVSYNTNREMYVATSIDVSLYVK